MKRKAEGPELSASQYIKIDTFQSVDSASPNVTTEGIKIPLRISHQIKVQPETVFHC